MSSYGAKKALKKAALLALWWASEEQESTGRCRWLYAIPATAARQAVRVLTSNRSVSIFGIGIGALVGLLGGTIGAIISKRH
jgi:hypothetical protein